jgi:oligoendopeptidase F
MATASQKPSPEEPADNELAEAAWDLEPLLDGDGEPGVERRLEEALARAQTFADRYAGKLTELDGTGLAEAMRELAAINDLVGRAGSAVSVEKRRTA